MQKNLILGTAGHIDHGKTSLIKALTGTDTDRLPEEKKRGITIELGFAELKIDEFNLGIVDVPGHEKFVRQMLAGATGMNLALLVVAADDSVKPQTREHLDVLRFLDLSAGIIVLTKCDTADADWMALVEEEIRELVEGTFLADSPIIRTSAMTGEGIDQLKSELAAQAKRVYETLETNWSDQPFRMAIDRAFTIAGHGTVVTGSVASGIANVGDQLIIEPGEIEVRVRGIQNHDEVSESVHGGQRAAINLAGIHRDDVTRGHELVSPNLMQSSRLVTAKVKALPNAKPIKNRAHVRFHVGTTEVLASISMWDRERLAANEEAIVQFFLSEPVVTTWNQPFVLRSESPVQTIGGGRVLVPVAAKLRRPTDTVTEMLDALTSEDDVERASAAIFFIGSSHRDSFELVRTAGIINHAKVYEKLVQQKSIVQLTGIGQRKTRLHRLLLDDYAANIENALVKMHDSEPLATVFERSILANRFDYLHSNVLQAVLTRMEKAGTIRTSSKGVGLADRGPKLTKFEKDLLAKLIVEYEQAGFQPPTVKECQKLATKNQKVVPQLISLAASDGDLVEVSKELYLHVDVDKALKEKLRQQLADSEGLTLSEIRELLGTTRKYAVPICEYLDSIGFTKRVGDLRQLG